MSKPSSTSPPDDVGPAFATRAIHAGQSPDPTTGAIMPPIYATSTFVQQSPGVHKGFDYGRSHNPTRFALERCVADLEGGAQAFAFASGLAAISTVLELVDAGSHIVSGDDMRAGVDDLEHGRDRRQARREGERLRAALEVGDAALEGEARRVVRTAVVVALVHAGARLHVGRGRVDRRHDRARRRVGRLAGVDRAGREALPGRRCQRRVVSFHGRAFRRWLSRSKRVMSPWKPESSAMIATSPLSRTARSAGRPAEGGSVCKAVLIAVRTASS